MQDNGLIYAGSENENLTWMDAVIDGQPITVWPWLLGHFVEGLLKVTSDRRKVLEIVNPCLIALQQHLQESGIGAISELFVGDHPHNPDGCISQAWSVVELLRLTYILNVSVLV